VINEFNAKEVKAAYTYDAGPNAAIYLQQQHMEGCLETLVKNFCPKGYDPKDFVYDPMGLSSFSKGKTAESVAGACGFDYTKLPDSGVKMIIVTKVGAGAVITERGS